MTVGGLATHPVVGAGLGMSQVLGVAGRPLREDALVTLRRRLARTPLRQHSGRRYGATSLTRNTSQFAQICGRIYESGFNFLLVQNDRRTHSIFPTGTILVSLGSIQLLQS